MADITFNWSRLMCPALAERQAGPWSRKISATSSAGRDMAASDYAAGGSSLLVFGFLADFGFLPGFVSMSSGLSILAIMPVATRV
jgi:hypothetical protein